jgi:hypothetical protein
MGSILDSCLPSFLAVCFTCRLLYTLKSLRHGEDSFAGYMFQNILFDETDYGFFTQLRYQALPTVCSVVAATSLSSEHGSIAVMASVVASMSCWGSVLTGLFTGWLVSILVSEE